MARRRRRSRKRRGLPPGEAARAQREHVPPPSGALVLWLAALESGFVAFLAAVVALAVGVWLAVRTGDAYWYALVIPAYLLRFLDQRRLIKKRQRWLRDRWNAWRGNQR